MYVSNFFKRNGSSILSVFASLGVIGTAVLSGKGTYDAIQAISKKKNQKLTKKEKIEMAVSFYIPALVVGFSTIACIAGANVFNKKQQAALTSAYMLISKSYREYRNKVKEFHGDKADFEILEGSASEKFPEGKIPENKTLFYDQFSERYFISTMENVISAAYHYNRNFALRGTASLNEFYEFLGIDTIECGYELGFSSCEMMDSGLTPWVEIHTEKAITCKGDEYYIIYFDWNPIAKYEEYEADW